MSRFCQPHSSLPKTLSSVIGFDEIVCDGGPMSSVSIAMELAVTEHFDMVPSDFDWLDEDGYHRMRAFAPPSAGIGIGADLRYSRAAELFEHLTRPGEIVVLKLAVAWVASQTAEINQAGV